mmetsp:Transcript_8596/g.21353  ORF Transcript_8596/g.21353 Transcript_8596/m.21353 type:complete len:206 (-) Transcript_8596:45-662(-)
MHRRGGRGCRMRRSRRVRPRCGMRGGGGVGRRGGTRGVRGGAGRGRGSGGAAGHGARDVGPPRAPVVHIARHGGARGLEATSSHAAARLLPGEGLGRAHEEDQRREEDHREEHRLDPVHPRLLALLRRQRHLRRQAHCGGAGEGRTLRIRHGEPRSAASEGQGGRVRSEERGGLGGERQGEEGRGKHGYPHLAGVGRGGRRERRR